MGTVTQLPTPASKYEDKIEECVNSLDPVLGARAQMYGNDVVMAALITTTALSIAKFSISYQELMITKFNAILKQAAE